MSYTNGKRPRQRTTHTRFQTQRGMAEIRHGMAVYNSMLKRGLVERPEEIVRTNYVICGCGAEGCGFTSVVRREDENAQRRMTWGLDPWRRTLTPSA